MSSENNNLNDLVNEDQFLRPQYLKEYIGQESIKDMLSISIKAAKQRNESLDHVLLYGPQGLGKTTLAQVISNEMESSLVVISGPSIEKPGDLACVLSKLKPSDCLFIDEIHRLPKIVCEVLYSAMEDFSINIIVGQDSDAHSLEIPIPPFTLIGATTAYGMLPAPLRDRFGITCKLDYYSFDDLKKICERTSKIYQNEIDELSSIEISKRSRGTPRITNRIFKRVRDYADVYNNGVITIDITNKTLKNLNIDEDGLDQKDIDYLKCLIEQFNGGPVGIENLSSSLCEDRITLENVYEPYLIKIGLIQRTTRGRIATDKAFLKIRRG